MHLKTQSNVNQWPNCEHPKWTKWSCNTWLKPYDSNTRQLKFSLRQPSCYERPYMCWINQTTTWENCYTCHAMTAGVWNWHGDATLYGPIHRPHEKVGHRISGVQAAVTKDHPSTGPIKQPINSWTLLLELSSVNWIEFCKLQFEVNRFSSDTPRPPSCYERPCMCWINQITTWENCYTCHAMTAGVWNWHGDATLYGPIHRPHEKVGHRISGVQAAVTKDHPSAGPIKQPILIVGHCFLELSSVNWIELCKLQFEVNRFSSDTWRLCVREIYYWGSI